MLMTLMYYLVMIGPTIELEFQDICEWAAINKMTINVVKTKEIVSHKSSSRNFINPTPINDINQVKEAQCCRALQ